LAGRAALADVYSPDGAAMVLKASVLSSQTAGLIETATRMAEDKALAIGCAAHAGNGVVFVRLNGDDRALASMAQELLAHVAELGGALTVRKAPLAIKPQLQVWGRPAGDWGLMQAIRLKHDPAGTMNPGRFNPILST